MNLKQLKQQLKKIKELNEKLENNVTFIQGKNYLSYKDHFKEEFDFELAKIEVDDIIKNIRSCYIFIQDSIKKDWDGAKNE